MSQRQIIKIESPTRVDLAGGTLDLWPLYNFVGEAKTVNVAIDIKTTATLVPRDSSEIELHSADMGIHAHYPNLQAALADSNPKLALLRASLEFFMPERGFRLETSSQSPVGGGLGGSSSLTISMMKAFEKFTERPFADVHAMVWAAHNIEAKVLGTPTGTQDYYPAVTGGISILDYQTLGVSQHVLSAEGSPFASYFLLVNTGKAHHSGINNFEVLTRAVQKDAKTLKALHDVKVIADEMATVCLAQDWDHLPGLFNREYDARIRLADAFTSPEIEKLKDLSLRAGALAVKICGAGGGGCVLVWCPPDRRNGVIESCQKAGFQILSAGPVAPLE